MAHLRFHHVFLGLLTLSVISAFVLSPTITDRSRAHLQNAFAPVARPTHVAAGWLHDRFVKEETHDPGAVDGTPRPQKDVIAENEQLRLLVTSLTQQLRDLQELNADRSQLGNLRSLTVPMPVVGADPGLRDALLLQGSSRNDLRQFMPVLYPGGLAGRIDRVGVGGAHVRLITDKDFAVTGKFWRIQDSADGTGKEAVPIAADPPLVKGIGNGLMHITSLTMDKIQTAGLAVNDWVYLSDPSWAPVIQGQALGRIIEIKKAQNPLFAEIVLQPRRNLLMLREVMVLTRER